LRWASHAFITAAIIAVLYRYWLIAPMLQNVSIGQWRLFAIVFAAVCGGALSLRRFQVPALSCGAMVGLIFGGTWVEWKSPHDVTISVYAAFASRLESFGQEILVLTFAATLAGFCCACFSKRRQMSGNDAH
jgi:hypothetical protein